MGFVNQGFNLDTDFMGGTSITVDMGKDFDDAQLNDFVEKTVDVDATVQKSGSTNAVIKTTALSQEQKKTLLTALTDEYQIDTETLSFETVSATIGAETSQKAVIAIVIAVLLMLIYIAIRFEVLSGVAAVMALIHDVLIMLAIYVIFSIPVNSSFVAAILTILGYSINATIVVFDRIRENQKLMRKEPFQNIVNTSVWQSMGRSINTTITTLITIVLLYFMGVDAIKEFALPIIVGVISGFYSSVFLSGNFWIMLKKARKDKNVIAE
jgi:preprotein translocase SecF subunit